ncbi:MAG: DMT family transporter [Candidatus Omnitrophota bacterium]
MAEFPPSQPNEPLTLKKWIVGLAFAISAQALFGTTFAFNKLVINQGVDPILLGFNRMGLVALCFLPLYWLQKKKIVWKRKTWRQAALVGGIYCTLGMILEYVGTKFTTASNASLIISTEAVFSIFLSVIILKERLNAPNIAGGMGAVIGVFLVVLEDLHGMEFRLGGALFGDFMVLASVISWGLYTIFSKRVLDDSDPIQAMLFVSLFSFASFGVINAATDRLPGIWEMSWKSWLVTIYLGAGCSGLGHFLYYNALKCLPASIVCMTLTLLPVFGVIFSIFLLQETLTVAKTMGTAVIIAGVAFAVWPRNHQPPPVLPEPIG